MGGFIESYLQYGKISDFDIQAVSGALVHKLFIDQPVPPNKFADIIYEEEIHLNKIPKRKIIKMSKKEYIDSFFDNGTLMLGNFNYYKTFDHEEIGDVTEGSFVLVGKSKERTLFAEIHGGFNNYVFCCYAGKVDKECLSKFGYDDYFEITEVDSFAQAIQKCLCSKSYSFSTCVYSKDKVVVSNVPKDFNFNVLSDKLIELANSAKYFVKPDKYSNQCEFRFLWEVEHDLDKPLIIHCPEAIKYCKRINL